MVVLAMIVVLVVTGLVEALYGILSLWRVWTGLDLEYQYQHAPLGVLCLGLATLLFLLGPPPGRDGGAGDGR